MTGGADPDRGTLVSGRFSELEDALCERVAGLRRGRPLAPLTIVVGSDAVRTRVGDLLVRELHAIVNVRVVTLARFAGDLVAADRGAPPVTLAGLARERFVRRLVDAGRDEAAYFAPVTERPHFVAALAATFADLREARIAPGSPSLDVLAADGGAAGERMRSRAADLARLYRAYCRRLDAGGLLDGAGVHLAAAAAVRAGTAVGALILYGIYDLNEAQSALVDALIAADADVFVPLPRYGRTDAAAVRTAALDAGRVERRLEAAGELRDRDLVASIWRARPATGGRHAEAASGDGTLCVVSVPDERAETREAVRAVVAAASGGSAVSGDRRVRGPASVAAFWDCAVVVPRADDVQRVAAALEAAGLPVACRRPDRSAGPRLLLRLAECLAPSAGEPFARRAVVDLLTAAPLRDDSTGQVEMALWLDEARRAGVVSGLRQWAGRVGRRRRGLEKQVAGLEAAASSAVADAVADDAATERLETLRRRRAAARGLEAAVGALERACGGLPHGQAGWNVWADAFAGALEGLFGPEASAAARDAAGRLRTLAIVDEEVGVEVAADALRVLLTDGSVRSGRVGREGVAVLTPLEVRGLSFHTVVFSGLAEGGFPVRGRPDPLLGDAERSRIAAAAGPGVRLPLAKDRIREAELLFAFCCEAARETLVLLAPRTDAASGRPRLPSRLLLRLASLGAGTAVGQDDFLHGKGLEPVWRRVGGASPSEAGDGVEVDLRERDTKTLLRLSAGGGHEAAREYLAVVLADHDGPGRDGAVRRLGAWSASNSIAPGAWDGLLGGDACARLAVRHPFAGELSPTRLERYIACPFAFFLRDVLRLDAPQEPGDSLEIDHLEFGSLAHDILQRTYRRVIDDGTSPGRPPALDAALEALDEAWSACCAEAEGRGVTGAELSWRVRREVLLDDLRQALSLDPVFKEGGGRPAAVEWSFGADHDRPVVLELEGGRRISFRGRIDRFDVTPQGARVIDYKTGRGDAEAGLLKARLGVQLPAYQLAVRQAGGRHEDVWCLYRLVSRRGGFRDLDLPDDEETTAARLRELVSEAAELVDRGMFPRTATADTCKYCDAGYACGRSDWALARKRRDPAVAAVVSLQAGIHGNDGEAGDGS